MTIQDVTSTSAGVAATGAVVDESVVVRRAGLYRHGLHHTALSYPASIARFALAARWLARQRVCVTAYSLAEVKSALAVGITPAGITVHSTGGDLAAEAAVKAGVGRFVVSAGEHIDALAACTGKRRRIVIGQSADLSTLVPRILVHPRIEAVGLHRRIGGDPIDPFGIQAIRQMIADMAWLRRSHGVLLTQVRLDALDPGGSWCAMPRVLRRISDSMCEAASEACEHHRYPRPMISVTLTESSLLPE